MRDLDHQATLIGRYVREMKAQGSSLNLSWGEDTEWECSWVTGGVRYTGRGCEPLEALTQAYIKGWSVVTGIEEVPR